MELFFHQALQELGSCHNMQRRVLLKAFFVISDYYIATTGESALILHHVLEVANRAERHSLLELRRIHWQDFDAFGELLQNLVNSLFSKSAQQERHGGVCDWCHTDMNNPTHAKIQQEIGFRSVFPILQI